LRKCFSKTELLVDSSVLKGVS